MRISKSSRKVWLAAAAGVVLLPPELGLYLAANHAFLSEARGRCSVIALGYSGDEKGVAGRILRFRMGVALDVLQRYSCGRLILSGGHPHSVQTEAKAMADFAMRNGVAREKLVLEDRSTSTWENVEFSLPSVPRGDHILIASDPAHALRAKRYLCRQAPEACSRTHVAASFRPFDEFIYQWLSVWWNGMSVLRDSLDRR